MQGPGPGPDDQRRVAVGPLHRHARVAAGLVYPLFIRWGAVEGADRKQLLPVQCDLAEFGAVAVHAGPTVEPVPSIEDFVEFRLDIIVVVAVSAAMISAVDIVGRAFLADMDDRRMQRAVGALRGPLQHAAHGRVGVLQRVEGQPGLAVVVFQQPDELLGLAVAPGGQFPGDGLHQVGVVGRVAAASRCPPEAGKD